MLKKLLIGLVALLSFTACSTKAEEIREKNKVPLKQLELCQKIENQQLRVECIVDVTDNDYILHDLDR